MNLPDQRDIGQRHEAVRRRIDAFPWHACRADTAGDWALGAEPRWLEDFCREWGHAYDWQAFARRLAGFRHVAGDNGLHALHFPVAGTDTALVLLHGWPSSCLEFVSVAAQLQSRGISVVVPTLPGFPLSAPVTRPIGPAECARLIVGLVKSLGYRNLVTHGGDWGAEISVWIGLLAPDDCRGVHLAMRGLAGNEDAGALLTGEERAWKERAHASYLAGGAYMEIQTKEPLTLGYALADSPVAMAAWICSRFLRWADGRSKGSEGAEAIIGRHFLFDTVTLYALTDRIVSSLWLYPGYTQQEQLMPRKLEVPTAIFALPRDPVFPWPPRGLLERHYNVVRWCDPPHGAHFAALEVPDLLVEDLAGFFAARS